MKCTLCITRQCNLRCDYCYIGQKKSVMPLETAHQVIDFIFEHAPPPGSGEKIEIGYFGGEPLLAFELIKSITHSLQNHPSFERAPVELTVVTNGTIFSDEIADFIIKNHMGFGISCDGPPEVQDLFRHFPDGKGSSAVVEKTIRRAVEALPAVMVNAVYHPRTLAHLPQVVDYFSSLGIRQIYLSPDFSAPWSKKDAELLPGIYQQVARQYRDFYLSGDPHYISLIDAKIAVILRDGYQAGERCKMGRGEFAFAPSGNIYPCERLIGSDDGDTHCIGNVSTGLEPAEMCRRLDPESEINPECRQCGVTDYCMNWCACSNYFSTGYYNRVGPFLCASEKTAIITALEVFQALEKQPGTVFAEHLAGAPAAHYSNRN